MQVWAQANGLLVTAPSNPYQTQLLELEDFLLQVRDAAATPERRAEIEAFREAIIWAQTMPPDDQLNFVLDIITKYYNHVPEWE